MAVGEGEEEEEEEEEVVNNDIISLLPDPILTTILSLIPVSEAVRTSLLSKRWRYLWTCIPRLNFWNFLDFPFPPFPSRFSDGRLMPIFYQILNSRQAPLQTCWLPICVNCPVELDDFFSLFRRLRVQYLSLRSSEWGHSVVTIPLKLFFLHIFKSTAGKFPTPAAPSEESIHETGL
ncbi:hypothetical protein MRB53_036050 [Persea americana]|uniref:Uncharacterized protein n=1 Tax=Persea americana TaxID=3435 RepID=A0ACC2K6W3_PERAE|nr:hypothetical protein MRB53_036050 [Persea americana]